MCTNFNIKLKLGSMKFLHIQVCFERHISNFIRECSD